MKNVLSTFKLILIFFFSLLLLIIGMVVYLNMSNSPEKIVINFFDSLKKGNYKEAYSYVSGLDKEELSYSDFLKEYQENNELKTIELSRTDYQVIGREIDNNTAKISLKITSPDIELINRSIFGEFLPMVIAISFDKNSDEEKIKMAMKNKIIQKLQSQDCPFISKVEKIKAINQEGKWYIYLNIHNKHRIRNLKEKAKQYEKEKKLKKAKEIYEELLKLDEDSITLEKKIEQLNKKIAILEDKQSYIKKLILKNIEVFDYSEFGGRREKAFKGIIINGGDKTLNEVEITVYMYDGEDNIIAEEKFYPITRGYKRMPFKTKFVKDFAWKLGKVAPTGWSGKIKVEVTDIKFE